MAEHLSTHTRHRSLCPECHRLANSEVHTERGSINTAHYLCPLGHAWQTTWTTAA